MEGFLYRPCPGASLTITLDECGWLTKLPIGGPAPGGSQLPFSRRVQCDGEVEDDRLGGEGVQATHGSALRFAPSSNPALFDALSQKRISDRIRLRSFSRSVGLVDGDERENSGHIASQVSLR